MAAIVTEPLLLVAALVLVPTILVLVACCPCFCCCNRGRKCRTCCFGPSATEGTLSCADDFACCVPKCKDSCCCVGPRTEPDRKLTQTLATTLVLLAIGLSSFSIAGAVERGPEVNWYRAYCGTVDYALDYFGYDCYYGYGHGYGHGYGYGSGSGSGPGYWPGSDTTLFSGLDSGSGSGDVDEFNPDGMGAYEESYFWPFGEPLAESQLDYGQRHYEEEYGYVNYDGGDYGGYGGHGYHGHYGYYLETDDTAWGEEGTRYEMAGFVLHLLVVVLMLPTLWNVRPGRAPTRLGMVLSLIATSIALVALVAATTVSVRGTFYYYSFVPAVYFAFWSAYLVVPLLIFFESRLLRVAGPTATVAPPPRWVNKSNGDLHCHKAGGGTVIVIDASPVRIDHGEVPPVYKQAGALPSFAPLPAAGTCSQQMAAEGGTYIVIAGTDEPI